MGKSIDKGNSDCGNGHCIYYGHTFSSLNVDNHVFFLIFYYYILHQYVIFIILRYSTVNDWNSTPYWLSDHPKKNPCVRIKIYIKRPHRINAPISWAKRANSKMRIFSFLLSQFCFKIGCNAKVFGERTTHGWNYKPNFTHYFSNNNCLDIYIGIWPICTPPIKKAPIGKLL